MTIAAATASFVFIPISTCMIPQLPGLRCCGKRILFYSNGNREEHCEEPSLIYEDGSTMHLKHCIQYTGDVCRPYSIDVTLPVTGLVYSSSNDDNIRCAWEVKRRILPPSSSATSPIITSLDDLNTTIHAFCNRAVLRDSTDVCPSDIIPQIYLIPVHHTGVFSSKSSISNISLSSQNVPYRAVGPTSSLLHLTQTQGVHSALTTLLLPAVTEVLIRDLVGIVNVVCQRCDDSDSPISTIQSLSPYDLLIFLNRVLIEGEFLCNIEDMVTLLDIVEQFQSGINEGGDSKICHSSLPEAATSANSVNLTKIETPHISSLREFLLLSLGVHLSRNCEDTQVPHHGII